MTTDADKMSRNIETAIRLGALFLVLYWVALIVGPFVPVIIWGVIIAVATRPLYTKFLNMLDRRVGLSATLFTAMMLVIIVGPTIWLGQAMVEWGTAIAGKIAEGTLAVPPPPDKVAGWPIVGERVHEFWALASTNLSAAVNLAEVQLKTLGAWMLKTAATVGMDILLFALSIIIAGVLLAQGDSASSFARRLFQRLMPDSATDFTTLSEQTIRSVAAGVIGVAFIQAALIGIGLVVMDVPAAPVWIVVCVLLGIVQLPATIVTLPIIIWVWGSSETVAAAIFTAYIVPAGLADNVLKPILLGRGVESPMLVIFIGAIGGFMLSGIVGLFVGAVILVLTYELFSAWLNEGKAPESVTESPPEPTAPAA